jgi:hypothetical protein
MHVTASGPDEGWSSIRLGRPPGRRTLLWMAGLAAIIAGGITTAWSSDVAGRAQAVAHGAGAGPVDVAPIDPAVRWMVVGVLLMTVGVVSLLAWLMTRTGHGAAARTVTGPRAPGQPRPAGSVAAELALLTELHVAGSLSVEEFAAAKRRLLGL